MFPHTFFFMEVQRSFREVIGELMETLEVGSNETTKSGYLGVGLKQEEEAIIMDQKTYIEGIKTIRKEVYKGDRRLGEEETMYKSIVHQLN